MNCAFCGKNGEVDQEKFKGRIIENEIDLRCMGGWFGHGFRGPRRGFGPGFGPGFWGQE